MKALTLAFALCTLPISALAGRAQDRNESIPVTIEAKGDEVRKVLSSIFDQEKKQYVIDAETHCSVYLSLDKADFHRALDIICNLSGLQVELREGIYFVRMGHKSAPKQETPVLQPAPAKPASTPKPAETKPIEVKPVEVKPVVLGPVPSSDLQKHVTTRLTKTSLRSVFDELSKQTGVKIVVDDKVPAYKLDAYLINTSLRYALNQVTRAAGLGWKLPQDRTVLITVGGPKTAAAVLHS